MRRAFQGHCAAAINVRGRDVGARKPERGQHVEPHIVERRGIESEGFGAEVLAQGPLVERERDVEAAAERIFDRRDGVLGETLAAQRVVIDRGRVLQCSAPDRIADDFLDLAVVVAEPAQRLRNRTVDDLEVAAAGELLELDESEIGLDSGRVAVHHERDGAGRGDDRNLGVAITVPLAEPVGVVPGLGGRGGEHRLRAVLVVERYRQDGEAVVPVGPALRRQPVVADDAQHRVLVRRMAGERAQFAGHFCGRRIGDTGHQGGNRAA